MLPVSVAMALPNPENVEVSVFDALGRRVAGTSGSMHAGRSAITIDGQDLTAGFYTVVLEFAESGEVITQSFSIVR